VLAVNAKSLDEYFKRLSERITRNHINPDDIWNLDEQGFMMGRGGKKSWLAPECRSKPPANATRKSGMGYVDRMCFDNWKNTTCLHIYARTIHYVETSYL